MYYVYVLQSEIDQSLYIGFTTDLRRRFREHNEGKSKFTKPKSGSWNLIYYESFKDKNLAQEREKSLKYYGKAWGQLKRRIGL